ncbi:MAG: LPS translocon maturation chaperone LptM [Bacteroidota bacterium]
MRRLTTLILVAAMAVSLSACGRKGKPIPPEGSTYPRTYPDVEFPQQPNDGRSGSETQTQ